MVKKHFVASILFCQLVAGMTPGFSGKVKEDAEGASASSPSMAVPSAEEARWAEIEQAWRADPRASREQRDALRPSLLGIASDRRNPHHWQAINYALRAEGFGIRYGDNADNALDWDEHAQEYLHPTLLQIAEDPSDPHQMDAVSRLWTSTVGDRAATRARLASILLQRAENPETPGWQDIIRGLWYSNNEQEQHYRSILRPLLERVAQEPGDPELIRLHARLSNSDFVRYILTHEVNGPRPY